jgi:hypothetical protein
MAQWFAPLDQAIGGTGDAVAGAGNYVGGGIADLFTGITGTAGSAAGDAAGGLFGGLGNWLIKVLAVGVAAWIVAGAV